MNEGTAGVSTLEPCATLTALVDANRTWLLPSVVAPASAFVRSSLPRATDAVDSARHCCCCCCCDTINSRALDCNARIGDTCHPTATRIARRSQTYGGSSLARRFGSSLRLASIEPQVLKAVVLLQQAAAAAACGPERLIPPHSRLPGFGLFCRFRFRSFGIWPHP